MTFSNEGSWDRVIRIVAGAALGYAAWTTWPDSVMARPGEVGAVLLLGALSAVALMTGLAGWCPLYTLFGISTKDRIRA